MLLQVNASAVPRAGLSRRGKTETPYIAASRAQDRDHTANRAIDSRFYHEEAHRIPVNNRLFAKQFPPGTVSCFAGVAHPRPSDAGDAIKAGTTPAPLTYTRMVNKPLKNQLILITKTPCLKTRHLPR